MKTTMRASPSDLYGTVVKSGSELGTGDHSTESDKSTAS